VTYDFLIDSYESERIKVLSVWSEFREEDLDVRPKPDDARGRNVREQMVHQCVSEDTWFRTMLGKARRHRGGLLVALAVLVDRDVRNRLAAERIVAKNGKTGERRDEQAEQQGERLQCRKRQPEPTLALRCRFLSERGAQIVGRLSHEAFPNQRRRRYHGRAGRRTPPEPVRVRNHQAIRNHHAKRAAP